MNKTFLAFKMVLTDSWKTWKCVHLSYDISTESETVSTTIIAHFWCEWRFKSVGKLFKFIDVHLLITIQKITIGIRIFTCSCSGVSIKCPTTIRHFYTTFIEICRYVMTQSDLDSDPDDFDYTAATNIQIKGKLWACPQRLKKLVKKLVLGLDTPLQHWKVYDKWIFHRERWNNWKKLRNLAFLLYLFNYNITSRYPPTSLKKI